MGHQGRWEQVTSWFWPALCLAIIFGLCALGVLTFWIVNHGVCGRMFC